MNDGNCVGAVRMECIEKAAYVIVYATSIYPDENNVNFEIATKNLRSVMECDGINTLINASEEYNGGEDVPELNALHYVWKAFANITAFEDAIMEDAINEDQAIALFDTGIDVISQLKSVDGDVASETIEFVFLVLNNSIASNNNNYVTKKYFQDKNILSKCLEVFKMDDDTWTCRNEMTMCATIESFNACRLKNLLDRRSDYEMLLPLLVMVLKEYPSNDAIRKCAIYLIRAVGSTVNDRNIIERLGAIGVLGALLASDNINEAEKNVVRFLIHKILVAAP